MVSNLMFYLLGICAGMLIGASINNMLIYKQKRRCKKIEKLINLFETADKYKLKDIFYKHEIGTDICLCHLVGINTYIELNPYEKDIRVTYKPSTVTEIDIFEYIESIKAIVRRNDSTNETITKLLV